MPENDDDVTTVLRDIAMRLRELNDTLAAINEQLDRARLAGREPPNRFLAAGSSEP
jgi:hypothetical protein